MPTASLTRNCWIAGAIVGLFVLALTAGTGSVGWAAGLFLALVAMVLLALTLIWLNSGYESMDADAWQPEADDLPRAVPVADPVAVTSQAEPAPQAAPAPAPQPQKAPQPTQAAPAAAPAAKAEPAPVAADTAKDETTQKAAKAVAPNAEPAKAEPAKAAAKPAPAKAATKVDPAPKPAAKAAVKRKAAAAGDDLKEIKGIGPKIEGILHENGVTTFAQIAAWDDAQIDRFADLIGPLGNRIRSENWVDQARTLAAGGTVE